MQNRVRVRRDRPSAVTWALALAVTMLAVYMITLSVPSEEAAEDVSAGVRVTREIDLQSLTVYFADMGVYPDEWLARTTAAEYAGRGAAAVVYEGADGFHVLGAGYALEADARRIAARLSQQESVEARVLSLSAPKRSLRVTAPEGDVEAIADADRTLRAQLNQLNTLALQVDRGEVSASSARTLAKVAASEVRSAWKRLEEIDGGADQPVCAGLTAILVRLEKNLASAAQRGLNTAEISGKLRLCHVDGAILLIGFLNELGASG